MVRRSGKKMLTFAHVPTQMPQSIKRMECKWCGKDGFPCIFDCIRKSRNELYDMRAVESTRSDQISN